MNPISPISISMNPNGMSMSFHNMGALGEEEKTSYKTSIQGIPPRVDPNILILRSLPWNLP